MGKAAVEFKELRFVIDNEETHAYVYLEASGDAPHTVQGWHHKVYIDAPVNEILKRMFSGNMHDDDPMMWPQEVPPQKEYFTPDPDAPMKMLERMIKDGPEAVLRDVLGPDAKITTTEHGISFEVPKESLEKHQAQQKQKPA